MISKKKSPDSKNHSINKPLRSSFDLLDDPPIKVEKVVNLQNPLQAAPPKAIFKEQQFQKKKQRVRFTAKVPNIVSCHF
jgi:hypothetical protein